MHLLITGGNGRLARALVAALSQDNTIRLFDTHFTEPLPGNIESQAGDLREPEAVATAVAGVDTVLHLAPLAPLSLADTPGVEDVTALDTATRGTYVLMNAAREAKVARVILGSTLDLFSRLPAHWRVNEVWRPRPEAHINQLCAWLAELSARENARVGNMQVLCLRFGKLVDDVAAKSEVYDSRWLHVEDAVLGVRRALAFTPDQMQRPDWSIFHITAPGARAKIRLTHSASEKEPFGYQPTHDFHECCTQTEETNRSDDRPWQEVLAPKSMRSRPIRKVVIFGAGGPMGAITAQELSASYTLTLTDIRPIAEIAAEDKPQSPGAPLPVPFGAPHENRIVDVRDPQQVMAACEGMDAIINCTVVRPDPVDAFRVNTIGAYNIVQAAVAHGIRRVVQTGPLLQSSSGWGGYTWDYDLSVDAPARPYADLYCHSKYLGQETCRVFAEYYGLEVPVLLFASLRDPQMAGGSSPFVISWPDTGRALRRALKVSSLPSPYEMMNISADLPHGHYRHDKAREILEWEPRDGLEHLWQD